MQKLGKEAIENALSGLNGWQQKDGTIQRKVEFKDFREAMAAMVQISYECDRMDHHPDWYNVYNRLTINLSTHDAGGITQNDIDLATKINEILA